MTLKITLFILIPMIASAVFTAPLFQQDSAEKTISFTDGAVKYRGTSFNYDKAIATEVKAQTIEASPASAKEPAPYDTIYPQHIAFELVGTYTAQPQSFIKPDIRVYFVPDYQKAYAADPKAMREVVSTMNRMRQILRTRQLPAKGELPTIPIPDGYYAFRAHASFIRFANGVGVVFLTQGQQDEMPVNNQNLSYEFQGMTDDGRFYVTAEFPVAAPFLAYDRDKANYGATVKEAKCYQCADHQRFMREYRAYVNKIRAQLEQLPAERFQPGLVSFDELIKSIKITDVM